MLRVFLQIKTDIRQVNNIQSEHLYVNNNYFVGMSVSLTKHYHEFLN